MNEPSIQIQQDLANDALIVEKTDEHGIKTRRSIPRHEIGHLDPYVLYQRMRASTADNDTNMLHGMRAAQNVAYQADERYRYGAQNAYGFRRKPAVFPRTNTEMDEVMIRRVQAREQLARERAIQVARDLLEKRQKHLKHAAVVAAIVVFSPLVIAAVLRMWGFALAWIAS